MREQEFVVTLTYFFEQYFEWWQSAATRYLNLYEQNPFLLRGFGTYMERYLEFKKMADRLMEETWRNLRLPTMEDITRLHERLNLLESRLVDLQEENQPQEMATLVESVKSLNQALGNRGKRGATSSQVGRELK